MALENDPAPERPAHGDGVYFDLDEATYHRDVALGSTDIGRLYTNPPDYWFNSGYNRLGPAVAGNDDATEAQQLGTAVHTFVLYGRDAFESRYAAAQHPGNRKAGQDERRHIVASGKLALREADYNRIEQAGTILRSNEFIAEAFEGGRAEVSVFWTLADGVRRKARFDYLKRRALVDLKSVSNQRRGSFRRACKRAIAEWNYPIQMEHYREGREQLARFVAEGRVYGDVDSAWLAGVAEHPPDDWAWVWIFFQSAGSPETYGISVSPANEAIRQTARVMVDQAIAAFQRFEALFGLGTPWVMAEPIEELDINDISWWGRDLLMGGAR